MGGIKTFKEDHTRNISVKYGYKLDSDLGDIYIMTPDRHRAITIAH